MPRGIGVMVSMQLSSLLMRRGFDARIIVGTGFAIAAYSQWMMAGWSLAADQWHFITTGLVQGLGLGLVFIPLNVMAFSTLPGHLRTDGSSLLNLLRSVGASVGISVTTVLLASNIQTAHADLGSHVTSATINAVDISTLDRFQPLGQTALSMIDLEINRQAAMIAYIDDFYLMMWLALAAIPLVLLMRKAKPD
jgi:DHA2 family multidrug resistance protein